MTDDAQRALRLAENLCHRANLAIGTPEHLLAAALAVVANDGEHELPPAERLIAATLTVHAASDTPPRNQFMWGSAARAALSATARTLADAPDGRMTARVLALGILASGEINPGFYEAVGVTRAEIEEGLG